MTPCLTRTLATKPMPDETPEISRSPVSIRSFDGDQIDPRSDALLRIMALQSDVTRSHLGLPPADSIEILIAEDLSAAVRSVDGETIDLEQLKDFGVERGHSRRQDPVS